MSGFLDALWDEEDLKKAYGDAHLKFYNELVLKHKEKGVSYRNLCAMELFEVLKEEVKELEEEIWARNPDGMIEEAAHIMVCGLILIDWAIIERERQEKLFKEMGINE